jgi:hypothetical protein
MKPFWALPLNKEGMRQKAEWTALPETALAIARKSRLVIGT